MRQLTFVLVLFFKEPYRGKVQQQTVGLKSPPASGLTIKGSFICRVITQSIWNQSVAKEKNNTQIV